MPLSAASHARVAGPAGVVLIDVGRLIWRAWTGRLPTGIDRVCLAYVQHFGDRGQAVVQYKGRRLVLSPAASRRVFALLTGNIPGFRWRMSALLFASALAAWYWAPRPGQLYLNVGHTGLDAPDLPGWIARHRLRAIYLIHDLIPIDTPQFCRPGEAARHERRMVHALASASGIIANSSATLDRLQAFALARGFAFPPATVGLLAGDAMAPARPPEPAELPYFLTIGTIEARKNHMLLLRIWRRLAARMGTKAPRLLIVGQRGWEAAETFAELERCIAMGVPVVELGRCDDAVLASLIVGARAVLMPSFAEGFGMPLIEALHLGTPVIASDLPVFAEIAGGVPTLISPLDAQAWEDAIAAFSGDCAERDRQLRALATYRAPDWESHFAQVDAWLKHLPGPIGETALASRSTNG